MLNNLKTLTKINYILVGFSLIFGFIDILHLDFILKPKLEIPLSLFFLVLQLFFLLASIWFVFKHNTKDFWLHISVFILLISITVSVCNLYNFT